MCSSTCFCLYFVFFKQKTAYEMRISDWSSDVCSSDLAPQLLALRMPERGARTHVVEAEQVQLDAEPAVVALLRLVAAPQERVQRGLEIGRASCRERVCQYV